MATYKVIQDIEADDKFLGPLSLKQFIFAAIFIVCAYLSFFFVTKHVWFLSIPLLPIMLVSVFLAFPWGRDQPTEIWLLAKLRFMVKPHVHVWDQSGMEELVSITAPKRPADEYTGDNLSQGEVKSRLKALADTIDTRGWAVKNSNVNLAPVASFNTVLPSTDRLVDASSMAQTIPAIDVQATDDIMDVQYNPLAQQLDKMINKSEQTHRQATLQKMDDIREGRLKMPKSRLSHLTFGLWSSQILRFQQAIPLLGRPVQRQLPVN